MPLIGRTEKPAYINKAVEIRSKTSAFPMFAGKHRKEITNAILFFLSCMDKNQKNCVSNGESSVHHTPTTTQELSHGSYSISILLQTLILLKEHI